MHTHTYIRTSGAAQGRLVPTASRCFVAARRTACCVQNELLKSAICRTTAPTHVRQRAAVHSHFHLDHGHPLMYSAPNNGIGAPSLATAGCNVKSANIVHICFLAYMVLGWSHKQTKVEQKPPPFFIFSFALRRKQFKHAHIMTHIMTTHRHTYLSSTAPIEQNVG